LAGWMRLRSRECPVPAFVDAPGSGDLRPDAANGRTTDGQPAAALERRASQPANILECFQGVSEASIQLRATKGGCVLAGWLAGWHEPAARTGGEDRRQAAVPRNEARPGSNMAGQMVYVRIYITATKDCGARSEWVRYHELNGRLCQYVSKYVRYGMDVSTHRQTVLHLPLQQAQQQPHSYISYSYII